MLQGYRKKVGLRSGGFKLYDELKTSSIKQDIKKSDQENGLS